MAFLPGSTVWPQCWPSITAVCGERRFAGLPDLAGSLRMGRKRLGGKVVGAGKKRDRKPEREEEARLCLDKAHLPPYPGLLNAI